MRYGIQNNHGTEIWEGDIFDVKQTINGQSKFVLLSCQDGLDIRYAHDISYSYQYDASDLVNIEDLEVIGKIEDLLR